MCFQENYFKLFKVDSFFDDIQLEVTTNEKDKTYLKLL